MKTSPVIFLGFFFWIFTSPEKEFFSRVLNHKCLATYIPMKTIQPSIEKKFYVKFVEGFPGFFAPVSPGTIGI